MTRTISIAASVTMLCALSACSQSPAALKLAAKQLNAAQVGTLEVCATGRSFARTENASREIYDVSNFIASADYIETAGRVQITQRQRFDPGTLHPFPVEERADRFIAQGYAWDTVSDDTSPTVVPATQLRQSQARERLAEIWLYPQGFVRAALKHKAESKTTASGTDVAFEMDGTQYIGTIDEDGEISRVQAWIAEVDRQPVHLDAVYSDYRDYHGVRFPRHIVRSRDGEREFELTVCSLRTGSAFEIFVPRAVEVTARAENTARKADRG